MERIMKKLKRETETPADREAMRIPTGLEATPVVFLIMQIVVGLAGFGVIAALLTRGCGMVHGW
jgi:hypothetical protein